MNTSAWEYIKKQDLWYQFSLGLFFFATLSRAYISFFVVFAPIIWLLSKSKSHWRELQPASKRVLLALLFFALWQLLSLLTSDNIQGELKSFLYYTYWLSIPVFVFTLANRRMDLLIWAFIAGITISEIISLGIFLGFWTFGKPPGFYSPFMIHIEYSILLALTAYILLIKLLSPKTAQYTRFILFFLLLLTLFTLFISNGRTGQAAFFITLPVFLLVRFRVSLKQGILTLALLLIASISIYHFSPMVKHRLVGQTLNSMERLLNKQDYFTSIGQRIGAWQVTYEIVKQSPWVGAGFGDYKKVFRQTIMEKFPSLHRGEHTILNNMHLHNQFLMAAVQGGMIGLIFLFGIIVSIALLPIKNHESNQFKWVFICCFFISCLAEPLFIKQFSNTFFVLSIVILLLTNESSHTQKRLAS